MMREEAYSVGVYWGARREAVQECARRAELFFHMLSRCDASLGQWYRRGHVPRGSPGHPVETHAREALESLLLHGRNRATSDKSVLEDLGFGLEAWNQRPDARATTLSLRCGAYTETVGNLCLLNLPSKGEAADRMLSVPTLTKILTCMATAWEPDWGLVTTNLALGLTPPDSSLEEARVGWMTYFSRRWGTVPPLPAPVRIEPVGALGTLVILIPERFTASNSEHVAQWRRVSELLDRAGLLRQRVS